MLCVMTMNTWLMISVVLASGIAHLLIRPYLTAVIQNHSVKTKRGTVTEEVELLHHGNQCSTGNKQCCKTNNIDTTTCLIDNDTNNV